MSPYGSHIRIESICHKYRFRGKPILDSIDMTIEPGQNVALVGRSGCGKSTLLQLISGMLRPSSGQIHIDGSLVKGPSPRWNMMFQKPSLYPWMTVRKNAALGTLISGGGESARKRVNELLDLVGLADLSDVNVQRLSGGQQQRVALARSLATQPELLLLDEPFSALDEITRSGLQADVSRITSELGLTRIVVTHDIDEAVKMATRVVVMSADPGRVVADLDISQVDETSARQQIRGHLQAKVTEDAKRVRGEPAKNKRISQASVLASFS